MGSKRNRNVKEAPIQVPIFIPTEDGAGELALGMGEIRGSTLVLTFNDLYPSQAILHRMNRGGIIGITFVIPEDEGAEHKEREDAIQAEQDARREAAAMEAGEEIPLSARDERDLELLDTIEPEQA